jgi:hypothetical protein
MWASFTDGWSDQKRSWIEEASYRAMRARCARVEKRWGIRAYPPSRDAWSKEFARNGKPNAMGVTYVWISGPGSTDAVTYAAMVHLALSRVSSPESEEVLQAIAEKPLWVTIPRRSSHDEAERGLGRGR